ncbi:BT0820 family HAD-type phosphatase [Marinifilum sp. D714]|uniref:BT0820 family HAD-type phosphatase n=1 Tax=Marinifilum sp. D714 TaxID=2937523 RepID=UPI0027C56549|nr:hydrolase [Marinifilum sp. D714]MDQ2178535.1 hydrolase [Marinifilum sp. D714]
MIIAVDFDGTIVEQKYPKLGQEIPFATSTLKMLQEDGHRLILWTYRAGKELEDAVEFCRSKGLEFYAINKNYPEEVFDESISRKIKADMYIDDMNYGGLPDWGEIYEGIQGRSKNSKSKKKKGFRLFG